VRSFAPAPSALSALALAAFLYSLASAVSCSSKATLVPEGGTCALATDCEEGLVCIHGQCSADLDAIQSTESFETGTAKTPSDEGMSNGDGMTGDAMAGSGGDATTPTPKDSGSPPDDSGTPPKDSGGTSPPDSGAGSPEASAPADAAPEE
jgi:hypothetical protein